MPFTAVNQFHSGTGIGDAVTNEMLSWREHLRALGHRSDVFATHIHPDLRSEIRPIRSYLGDPGALLIIHHSMGFDAFETVVGLPDRKALVYHNITPESFFEDEYTRRFVRLGHRQLRRLVPHVEQAVAVSAYNRRELVAAGYRDPMVIPISHPIRLRTSARSGSRTRDWLFVGRLVPNKRQLELIDAFAVFAEQERRTRLHLVGDLSRRSYVEAVEERIRHHGLTHRVLLHGKVSDEAVVSAYARHGVFVCLSEHEGVGVPLLEAMAAGMPVVARRAAAVPETMGGAGVLLTSEGPAEVAAVVRALLDDGRRRNALVRGQDERVSRLEVVDAPAAIERLLARIESADERLEVQIQGPFETSYSLAVLNRRLAVELDKDPMLRVSIFATEGPGDYEPDPADVCQHPTAEALWRRSSSVPYPDVVIRQMYPPRVADAPGAINLGYFGWEETRVPAPYIQDFNQSLDAVGTMSSFVADSLVDSGLTVPVLPTGVGVDQLHPGGETLPELDGLSGFRFLNVSSAFPRKGIDVLLAAYFSSFTASDDVVLVLKTFPNPHNDVGRQLDHLRAQHPDSPHVVWIDRDLQAPALGQLYAAASCYVHASRGEGFGLPVAEAMLSRVPVISVAQSGTADFVDDSVAVTIPFHLQPARSHLAVEGSEWAEPDVEVVAKEMREAYESRHDPPVEQIERARERIADQFSWTAVADRWRGLIWQARQDAFVANVAMVSTFNSRCGIAEYNGHLTAALGRRAAIRHFADRDAMIVDPSKEATVERWWRSRWEPNLEELAERLRNSDADVVHVQFNFGFFELADLARFLEAIDRDGRATVLTLHATHEPVIGDDVVRLSDIALTLSQLDQIIVHQRLDVERLETFGVTDNVLLVPIGSSVGGLPSREVVRRALDLEGRPVLSTFGFALPHKGLLELIRAVDHLRDAHPDVVLLACCSIHPDASSRAYFTSCELELARLQLEGHVRLIPDYLAEREARTIIGGTDLVVLPYEETPESASAALRFVIGCGTPVLTTALPIFADAAHAVEQVESNEPAVLAAAIQRLLADDDSRDSIAERCSAYARSVSWSSVAGTHAGIYRRVARRRLGHEIGG